VSLFLQEPKTARTANKREKKFFMELIFGTALKLLNKTAGIKLFLRSA